MNYTLQSWGKVCQAEKKLKTLDLSGLCRKQTLKLFSIGCIHMCQNNLLMKGEVSKNDYLTLGRSKRKSIGLIFFFAHMLTVGVKWNGNMIWIIQPNSEWFSWPSQQCNQIVEHSTSCLPFPIWHVSRESGRRRMSSRKVWSLDLTSVVEIWEGWRHWNLIFPLWHRFQDLEWKGLESINCFVKQAESSRWKMLSFSPVLKRIIESEKWKWPPTSF